MTPGFRQFPCRPVNHRKEDAMMIGDGALVLRGGILSAVLVLAGVVAPAAAGAQEAGKGPAAAETERGRARAPTRVMYDNGDVRVQEVVFGPGEMGQYISRPFRVIRVLQGGTMLRIYPEGRSETVVYRTGDVIVYEPEQPFVPKNVGDTDIVLFVVALKSTTR
jgi:mannose-6-phosphate isomerase-like protein (cupin superfamily)